MAFTWRQYTDWAKRKPIALRIADLLGRGRGRLRLFDDVNPPARPAFVPDLANWHRFEQENPSLFIRMYNFIVQKPL